MTYGRYASHPATDLAQLRLGTLLLLSMAASNLLKFAVAYDGSESSVASLNAMVKHSLFAAAPERVEVHLISCVPPVNTYPPFGMPIESAEAIMTERLAEATRMLQEAQARVQAAGGVRSPSPSPSPSAQPSPFASDLLGRRVSWSLRIRSALPSAAPLLGDDGVGADEVQEHVKLHVEVGDARIVLTRICTEQQADHLYLGTRGYSNITGCGLPRGATAGAHH